MREIKFRAWDNAFKEMSTNSVNIWGLGEHAFKFPSSHAVLDGGDLELIQYVWLKDKNNQEIYEGDILGFPWRKTPPVYVQWYEPKLQFRLVRNNAYAGVALSKYVTKKLEIIGNIYEHPTLLENKEANDG